MGTEIRSLINGIFINKTKYYATKEGKNYLVRPMRSYNYNFNNYFSYRLRPHQTDKLYPNRPDFNKIMET